MGGLAEVWEGWEVEILLISSLLLQVLLLVLTECRRRVSWALLSAALNGMLWLLYQLADSVAIYVLGHMSLSSKPREQQQLMAFWASLLLVHLGGQDTITAYAMEDNDLWLRHLFTLAVQAAGAAYVLYKYDAGGSRELLAAAVLMFLVGVSKYLERIYALYSSGLDSISKFLDGFEVLKPNMPYPTPVCPDDAEEVLQGAHDLLHVCMGQLVDYKVWPSHFQIEAISAYHDRRTNCDGTTGAGRSMLLELVGMQLSLMRDILYTKAAVIHTWYGCVFHIVSTVSTIVAFYLFQQSTLGGDYGKVDMVVTYILLSGALSLEVVSLLRAGTSTWTCAWLRAAAWNQLHGAAIYLRRGVKAAQRCRKWSGSIGQHDLLRFHQDGESGACYAIASCVGLEHWWNRLRFSHSIVISEDVEDLLLREVERMVEACGENEHTLRSSGQQLALGAWGTGGAGGVAGLYDGVVGVDEAGFDGSILVWHYATDAFLNWFNLCCRRGYHPEVLARAPNMFRCVQAMSSEAMEQQQSLGKAIRALSRYMMFLLVERHHLLPSPVRRSQYDNFCAGFKDFMSIKPGKDIIDAVRPAVHLTNNMLAKCGAEGVEEVLQVVSRVWVEMLCYAASHCSNASHARQLSSGTEFITVTWILTTALYNRFHGDDPIFKAKAQYFLERHMRHRMQKTTRWSILWLIAKVYLSLRAWPKIQSGVLPRRS